MVAFAETTKKETLAVARSIAKSIFVGCDLEHVRIAAEIVEDYSICSF